MTRTHTRVLSVHAGADTGGIGWALAGAFRDHPTIALRAAVRQSNYIDYPHDLPWDDVHVHGRAADVVHLHNTFRTAGVLGLSGLPKVIHHHGTHYRDNADLLNAQVAEAEAVAVVSTLDLLDYGPNLTWVPHPYRLDLLPIRTPVNGRLRVGHAPTDRAIKSTDAFLAACDRLSDRVEPVLIEQAAWADCLRVKATCDVYFDQVHLGYGCNAVEAWGMGIPVIAGAPDTTLNRMADTFGHLPFLPATEATIGDALDLICNPAVRDEYTLTGRRHAQLWHDGTETVRRLTPIYHGMARTA